LGVAEAARAAGVAKIASGSAAAAAVAAETAVAAAILSMRFSHRENVFPQNCFPGIEAGSHVHCSKAEM